MTSTTFVDKIKTANQKISYFFKQFEIKNRKLKTIFSVILFLTSLHVFYNYIGVYKFIDLRPVSIHSSAQCQRASIALNYYKNDMEFFKPRVQKFSNGTGVTGVEFPIIYYAGAVMYKIFGFNETYTKSISLIIITIGFVFFYLLMLQFISNSLIALSLVASGGISPVLMYYSPSIMPDAPSLGLILMAWYFFFQYLELSKKYQLNLFIVLGTLAALIKVVSIISFFIIICLIVLDRLKFFKKQDKVYLFKEYVQITWRIALGFVMVATWYVYANWLATAYGNPSFSLSPVMVEDLETLNKVGEYVKNVWLFQYYSSETYTFLLATILFILITIKHVNRLLLSITVLYILGSLVFVFLFLNQFMNHDYYIISILPCVFFLLLTFAVTLNKLAFRYSYLVLFVFGIIIFFNLKECVIKAEENYYFRYVNRAYLDGMDYMPYGDLEPRLRALGIKRTDKVISGFDDSYCSSLYLMDQLGVTIGSWYDKNMIDETLRNSELKYLILNDSAKFNKVYQNNLENKIILTHRGLIVYKLR